MRGNEGVFIMGKTIEFHMGGNVELKAVSIVLCMDLRNYFGIVYNYI